jgi:nucleoid DNA-binding protein
MKTSYNKFLKLVWKESPKKFTLVDIGLIAKIMAKVLVRELSEGRTVAYSELGEFTSTYRPSRMAYRPDLKEFFKTRPTMVPKFKFRRETRRSIMDSCSQKVWEQESGAASQTDKN